MRETGRDIEIDTFQRNISVSHNAMRPTRPSKCCMMDELKKKNLIFNILLTQK